MSQVWQAHDWQAQVREVEDIRLVEGFVKASFTSGPDWTFRASERERLCTAFRDGHKFFEGEDEWGAQIMVDLTGCCGVTYFSPQSISNYNEWEKLQKAKEIIS